ncbi:MAG: UvrD-helicase domain-containing protein [Alphaproteobacteria bacterium]|nr:UvrD-helicase domain-containing protein [Alphaproteobacteria bacterium]
MTVRVIRAAAGCGKTTALARAYLQLVADDIPVERIVAITFTRRAAAELVERVGLALRAAAGDDEALAMLGQAGPVYLEAAPKDPAVARAALADLGSAPIGTTDHFVHRLLSEFALDAALPLPDKGSIALDIGLVAVPELTAHLDAAARRLLDPPEADPPDEVKTLTRYFTLGEILEMTTRSAEIDGLDAARGSDVLHWMSTRIAEALEGLDLEDAFKIRGLDRDATRARLADITNKGAEWAIPAVEAWLHDGAPPASAPIELVSWIRKVHRGRARDVWNALEATAFDFGITTVRMDDALKTLRHPYEDPAHLALADTLRDAVESLRIRVASDALESAALQGELSHAELTRAAAKLCESPLLVGRFAALLVDEIQDASPDQLELYEALGRIAGMRSVFVGDGRQSIYLFRGGEPEGLERLTKRTEDVVPLLTNHRSTPPLVDAHRALFEALEAPMKRRYWTPLESLEGLAADPERADNTLDGAVHGDLAPPIVIVNDGNLTPNAADDHALVVFWDRVRRAWSDEEGHRSDSAAVLCASWRAARRAADLLRRLAGDETIAWVDGGDGWLGEGVARDLGMWLRALLDRADDVAWLAVWKHPSIGLTDGALARIRKGIGVGDRGWATDLGAVARIPRLERPHRDDDIAAFAQAREPLLAALADIGRDDTSLVLDRLVTAMGWRTLLAASPGGLDEVARLEVLLDWIGELDAQGASVDAIASMLSADSRSDVPRVRLERPERTITCTTVFQAKGLAWDHVCVFSPGRGGRIDIDPDEDAWMQLGGKRVRLLGLRFDPEGGLVPYHDPLKRLGIAIRETRYAEEGARLAYVAVTRARRSVTMGLPKKGRMSRVQQLVAETWAKVRHPAILHVAPPGLPETERLHRYEVVATGVPPFELPDLDPPLIEQAPSAAAARYSREQRQKLAELIRSKVTLGGFQRGGGDIPPPGADHPDLSPADWGTLAHGWFAAWRFDGPAPQARIAAWLGEEWGAPDPAIASWLAAVSTRLREQKGQLWDIVTDPSSKLWFEYPLVGRGGADDNLLLSGRIDLLVQRPKGVVVVDFKAGTKSPRGLDDLIEGASLRTYGPQLASYADALERMGTRVEHLALWYVRTGASVMWRPG